MTAQSFYVTGGTLRDNAPSYVERQADKDLLKGLLKGEFCYVLTARQMGKSSLMVRTAAKLREQGVGVVALDLTAIGQNLTPDQWYKGLLHLMGPQLNLEDELEEFWLDHQRLSPAQRLFAALREVALVRWNPLTPSLSPSEGERVPEGRVRGRLVIFIDEIDVVRSLPFSSDEFFAAVRECYNRRTADAEFDRLTFCLLGVALASDLIRDSRTTPFNIGRRIAVHDFTAAEAVPLARGLGLAEKRARAVLQRILHWTGGHPYLTQRLCRAVAEANVTLTRPSDTLSHPMGEGKLATDTLAHPMGEGRLATDTLSHRMGEGRGEGIPAPRAKPRAATARAVDRLCEELFLSKRAREQDDNLLFVRERILRSEADRVALLDFYARIRGSRWRSVRDDDANPLLGFLRLAGIVRVDKGRVQVRNRIYHRVFDLDWVNSNMPDAELRRQRAAYFRGLRRTAAVAAVIVAMMLALVLVAKHTANESRRRLVRMNVEKGMRLVEEGDPLAALAWFADALRLDKGEPVKEAVHRQRLATIMQQCPKISQIMFEESHYEFDVDGQVVRMKLSPNYYRPSWISEEYSRRTGYYHRGSSPDLSRIWIFKVNSKLKIDHFQVWDANTRLPLSKPIPGSGAFMSAEFSPDGTRVITYDSRFWIWTRDHLVELTPSGPGRTARIWDATTGNAISMPLQHEDPVQMARFSPDGRRVVTLANAAARVWDAATGDPITAPLIHEDRVVDAQLSPDGGRRHLRAKNAKFGMSPPANYFSRLCPTSDGLGPL